jgi:hypothetical protein
LQVLVYPNPTDNRVYIKGIQGDAKVEVFSIEGRKLLNLKLNTSNYVDLNLPSGMYLMHISAEHKTSIEKIVIK